MYLGRHPISHEPYLCRLSALDWYLSAGLTRGALSWPRLSRGSERGLGASLGMTMPRAATEVAKHRTTASFRSRIDGCEGRKAEARALFLPSLLAIVKNVEGRRGQLIEYQPVASIKDGRDASTDNSGRVWRAVVRRAGQQGINQSINHDALIAHCARPVQASRGAWTSGSRDSKSKVRYLMSLLSKVM